MMNIIFFIVLALGLIATGVFLFRRVKYGDLKAAFLKAVASSLFIGTACTAAATVLGSDKISFALFVIPGLIFGLMGDVWLDLKWIYPKDDETFTFAGFGAFMIGHLLYITGVLINYADFTKWLYIAVAAVAAVIATVIMILLEKPMKVVYGKFKTITIFYGFVLFFVTFLSGNLALMNGFKDMTLNFMFVGGVLFAISDVYLSGTYFGEGKRRPVDIIINHVAYYAAQFIIASSILFI